MTRMTMAIAGLANTDSGRSFGEPSYLWGARMNHPHFMAPDDMEGLTPATTRFMVAMRKTKR